MKIVLWDQLEANAQDALLRRPLQAAQADVEAGVSRIIAQVRADGDGALRALTRRYD